MHLFRISTVAAVAALALGACATGGPGLPEAQQMKATGSAFNVNLHKQYTDRAAMENAEWDDGNSGIFSQRAIAAGKGETVLPAELASRKIPKGAVKDLTAARAKLMDALDRGAAEKSPAAAAKAQVMFDCWMEEQEENIQPWDIKACRSGFDSAMETVVAALETPMMKVAAKPAPMPQPAPAPKPAPPPALRVMFDFNSAKLTPMGMDVVQDIATVAGKEKLFSIHLSGYTDRAGDQKYNMVLSKARVDAVADALIKAGVPPTRITKAIYGEEHPAVVTPDGQAEPANRRVEAAFKQ